MTIIVPSKAIKIIESKDYHEIKYSYQYDTKKEIYMLKCCIDDKFILLGKNAQEILDLYPETL